MLASSIHRRQLTQWQLIIESSKCWQRLHPTSSSPTNEQAAVLEAMELGQSRDVVGPPGTGKTTLISHAATRLRRPHRPSEPFTQGPSNQVMLRDLGWRRGWRVDGCRTRGGLLLGAEAVVEYSSLALMKIPRGWRNVARARVRDN